MNFKKVLLFLPLTVVSFLFLPAQSPVIVHLSVIPFPQRPTCVSSFLLTYSCRTCQVIPEELGFQIPSTRDHRGGENKRRNILLTRDWKTTTAAPLPYFCRQVSYTNVWNCDSPKEQPAGLILAQSLKELREPRITGCAINPWYNRTGGVCVP